MEVIQKSIWYAVANVKSEIPFGENKEIKKGTKHFKSGAKVYVIDAFWGMCESVSVIGRHRKSLKYISVKMNATHLENFRLALVYSPKVIELTKKHFSEIGYIGMPMLTKEYSERLCQEVPKWETY